MKFKKMKAVLLTIAMTMGMAVPAYAAESGDIGTTYGEQIGNIKGFNRPFTDEEWQQVKAEVMANNPNMTEFLINSLRIEWEYGYDERFPEEYYLIEEEGKIRLYKGYEVQRNSWYWYYDSATDQGKWRYSDGEGFFCRNQWVYDQGKWYYLEDDCGMSSGWKQLDGSWYYFVDWIDTTLGVGFEMKGVGEMLCGEWLDHRFADEKTWFYLDADGKMVTGWQKINGKWYYFNENGYIKQGWLQDGTTWYYLSEDTYDCSMAVGWQKINGTWYYFDESGAMLSNCTKKINGVNYTFSASGAWIK